MTDCPNAEMRDRLPDLLHERLETSVRAAVMAHVDQCDDWWWRRHCKYCSPYYRRHYRYRWYCVHLSGTATCPGAISNQA